MRDVRMVVAALLVPALVVLSSGAVAWLLRRAPGFGSAIRGQGAR